MTEKITAPYEQRVDRTPADLSLRIAMIGTGLGGLLCSRILQDSGLQIRLFDKSRRPGGRASTRKTVDGFQFDHGAQYFTIRDPHLTHYLESWLSEELVGEWKGHIVAIEEAGKFSELTPLQRYVGTPSMESLAQRLATDLSIQFESEVVQVLRNEGGYQLLGKDERDFGEFDIVLWNCPPNQTQKQLPPDCDWRARLADVEMLPCWAVLIATESRWDIPLDGAFVNQGKLSWIARDSSKPARPSGLETWVLHSKVDWANEHLEASQELVAQNLIAEAERVTGSVLPGLRYTRAHRWLYSRPAESLPESSLWDNANRLGACGDWCGAPRIEGALKSGISLAGRVLGGLHERPSTRSSSVKS